MARTRLLHVAQYVVLRALLAGVLALGHRTAIRVALRIARIASRLDKKHRNRALENLSRALPELSPEAREKLTSEAITTFALAFAESLFLGRLIHATSLHRHVRLEMHPEARRALDSGKGAIVVTAHIGNWELSGATMSFFGYPPISVARPISNPLLDRFLIGNRERFGQKIISKRGALRDMSRAIREGRMLAMLVDQNAGRHGIFPTFFGRAASTTGAPATLAWKYDVPLIPAWGERLPGDFQHVIRFEEPLDTPHTGDRTADVMALTQAMNDRIEAWVRRKPGQWLWAHRRWKTRPPEEAGRKS